MVRLTFLKISNSSLSKNLIKRNCVAIKKIKGNVSNTIDGEFNRVNKKGKNKFVSVSFKYETSSKIFKIITSEKKIAKTINNIFKNDFARYFWYTLIIYFIF